MREFWMKRGRNCSWLAGLAVGCGILCASIFAHGASEKQSKEPVAEEEAIPVGWKEIVEKYLAFREEAWPMIIPATEGEVFGSWDSIIANVGKRIVCGWFWYFQGGEIRVEKGALPARKEPAPVEVVIYEDIYNSRIVVLGMAEGEKPRELYSRKVLPILDIIEDEFDIEAEICMRRMAIRLTALPFNYVAPKQDIQLYDLAVSKSFVPLRMMGGEYPSDKIWLEISKHDEQPNHFAGLTIHAPTSSVSRLDVFANADLLDPATWSLLIDAQSLNEEGLLAFTNTIVNFPRRYFLAANADAHSDNDGLSDGRERFLYFTSPYDEDTDGDSLPDNWEIQYGLDPLDNGTINTNNGAIGDPDGDGFSNEVEMQQGAPPNNSAWNGEQLVWKLMNCTTGRPLRSGSTTNHSLWVEVEDSANCGGPNGEIQVETMTFHVGDLLDCGYFVDIEVEGAVEDEHSTYDKVYVTTYQEEYYFEGSDGNRGCPYMTNKTAIRNHLILPNSDVVLKYDTVGWMYHVGGYAEIINATTTGTLRLSFDQNEYHFCASDGNATIDIQTGGFKPDDIAWSLEGIVTGTGTRVTFDPSSLQPGDHPLTAESAEFPCAWASCNVNVHKVEFETNLVFSGWSSNGTYTASGNLTSDSYDTSMFTWSLTTLNGDPTALIHPKTGLLSFGCQSGGIYRVEASAPGNSCSAIMTAVVMKVELYTDPQFSITFDDWPEVTNVSIRSPKFIFGKDDNIYMVVRGIAGLGDDFSVNVKSESDTAGFDVQLSELAAGVYQNNPLSGDLLRLDSDTGSDVDAKYIKVVDEEILTFSLKHCGDVIGCHPTVMADRGEFATATARSFDSLLWFVTPPLPSDRTPIWNVAADEFANDVVDSSEANLNWWDVGCLRGSYSNIVGNTSVKYFIQDSGQDLSDHGESDMFYSQSHGNEEGNLSGTLPWTGNPTNEDYSFFIYAASDLSGVWDNDVDWAVIKACSILCHTNVGRAKWECALKNGRRAHGILSFEGLSLSDYTAYDDDFMDELGARHSIISSWINANSGVIAIDQPYGIVYHSENLDDKFQSPSEGVSLTADQTTDNFSYFWRDAGGSSGTDSLCDSSETTVEHEIQWRGKSFQLKVPSRSRHVLPSALASVRKFNISLVSSNFDLWREWDSGVIRLSRDLTLRSTEIDKETARKTALAFAKQGDFPSDAQISDVVPIHNVSANGNSATVAYIITFAHSLENVAISGDFIKLIVQSDGVKFFTGFWHDVGKESNGFDTLPQFGCADLQSCMDWFGQTFDVDEAPPTVISIIPSYYAGQILNSTMIRVPVVWHVTFSNGSYANYIPNGKKVISYKTEQTLQRQRCISKNSKRTIKN